MVGGKIYDKWIWGDGFVAVLVLDDTYADDYAEVRLEVNEFSLSLDRGGSIWWQGRNAFWTPRDRSFVDMPVPRIGYSVAVDEPDKWRVPYLDAAGISVKGVLARS